MRTTTYYFPPSWSKSQKEAFLESMNDQAIVHRLPSGDIPSIEVENISFKNEEQFARTFGWTTSMGWRTADYLRAMAGVVIVAMLAIRAQAPVVPTLFLSWTGGAIAFAAPAVVNQERQRRLAEQWAAKRREQEREIAIKNILDGNSSEDDFRLLD